jgi:hypothetical protein
MEQFFAAGDPSVEGASTVKILSKANDQNIPIYTITASNIATILPKLQTGINDAIQNAIYTGKEVITPESNVSINGWIGTGYIIYDPSTGSGAYMISGGTNGIFIAALGTLWIACGEIIYDEDPQLGMEIINSGINLLIEGQNVMYDAFKQYANICFDLGMNFMPWGKVFAGLHFVLPAVMGTVARNAATGRAFQNLMLSRLKQVEGFVENVGAGRTVFNPETGEAYWGRAWRGSTIPDGLGANISSLWEVKSSIAVFNTGNIAKQIAVAKARGIPLNIVVRNGAHISSTVSDMRGVTINIFEYNSITGEFIPSLPTSLL